MARQPNFSYLHHMHSCGNNVEAILMQE